mgnify:CR=1 FL=1
MDDKTLEIQLAYPAPYFLSSCAGSSMLPMRQDIVEANGDSYGTEADKIVGNGPFSLKEWVHNSKISYVKNPSYWNADAVKLEELTMRSSTRRPQGSVSSRTAALTWFRFPLPSGWRSWIRIRIM